MLQKVVGLSKINLVEYSVVIPIFNSSKGIQQLFNALNSTFSNASIEYIFVDDGSLDESWNELKVLKKNNSNVRIFRLAKNFGQHAATICGFAQAKGKWVLTLDDDLEVFPSEFEKLISIQKKTNAVVVYGEYAQEESFSRKISKSIYKRISKLEGSKKGRGSSFRLIQGDLARKLAESHRHFIFIDEFLLWYTDKVEFVNVNANPNPIRKSRYDMKGLVKTTGRVILYSTAIPLKFVTFLGFGLAAVNFLVGCFFLYKHYVDKIDVKGYTSLIVSILFSTGLIIFCIGIIAQYLRAVLKNMNNSPLYFVAEEEC